MTRPSRFALAFAAALIPAAGALADPATPEGADKLKSVLELYLGHPAPGEASSVAVSPEGSGYRASFDLKRMSHPFETFGVAMDPATSTMLLTPNADGTWKVTADAMPPITMHVKDQTVVMRAGSYAFEGLFDPKLGAFTTASGSGDGLVSDQEAPAMTQHRRIGHMSFTQTATPADGGTVSGLMHYTIGDTTASMTITPPKPQASVAVAPSAPAMTMSYTLPNTTTDLSAERLHQKPLLDLWAFLVAHPDRASLTAAQDAFRSALKATLPVMASLKQSGTAADFALTTDIGDFSAKSMKGAVALDGLDGSGTMTFGLSVDSLKVPSADLPVWSVGLLPTSLDITSTLTGFHLDDALREAVSDFDLKLDQGFTPEQSARIGKLIWPGNGKLMLAPSHIVTGLLDLTIEGDATLDESPAGRLTVTAKGVDKAIAMLRQAASDPTAGQILAQFILAKNLAKPNPDGSLTWLLETGPGGAVTVNGTPLQ